MDKQFFSKENYITIKEIIIATSGIQFNKDEDKELFENMVNLYNNTDTQDYHVLNKKCISLYTEKFKRQIPKKENEQNNIINPVQKDIQNKDFLNNNSETEVLVENTDTSDLFAKLKKEREQSFNNLINNESFDRNVNTEDDIEEQFNNFDRNVIDFNNDDLVNNFPNFNDNLTNEEFENKILNSIDKETDLLYENEKLETIETDILHNNILDENIGVYKNYDNETKLVQREILVVIDSRDRDLFLYPNPNNFQVKFEGKSDTIVIPQRLDKDGSIIHENSVLFKGYEGANLNVNIKNIKSIRLVNVSIPYRTIYINGNPPTVYTDANQTQTLDLLSEAYHPIYLSTSDISTRTDMYAVEPQNKTKNKYVTGIPTDLLDEPYLLVYIDEISTQKWYNSTNEATDSAFCRIMSPSIISTHTNADFAIFSPQDNEERIKYDLSLLSSIDKMTLHIKDQNERHIHVGQDKIFIKEITESKSYIINKYYSNDSVIGTDITITTEHDIYRRDDSTNNKLNHHGLKPGDTIYIYNTKPCVTENVFLLNPKQTKCNYNSANKTIEIKYKYMNNQKTLNLSSYLFVGDYISINNKLFKIESFTKNKANLFQEDIDYNSSLVSKTNYKNVGFLRQNKRGFTSDKIFAVNSNKGHKVTYVYDESGAKKKSEYTGTSIKFTIDLPWHLVKKLFENKGDNHYIKDTFFFINKSLQISYMFKFSIMEKENENLESELI